MRKLVDKNQLIKELIVKIKKRRNKKVWVHVYINFGERETLMSLTLTMYL